MKPEHRKSIDYVLDGFNFEKLHEAMVRMNWKWAKASGCRVPSVEELIKCAEHCLITVAEASNKEYFCGTGGFFAHKTDKDYFELKFVVEEYDNFDMVEDGKKKRKKRKRIEKKFDSPLVGLEV